MGSASVLMMTFGVVALLASWVLLLIRTSNEDFSWGLCTVFMPPLSYLYGLFRLDIAGESIVLSIIGIVLVGLGLL